MTGTDRPRPPVRLPRVRLRPVREADLDWMLGLADPAVEGELGWTGHTSAVEQHRRYERDGFLGDDRGRFVIWDPAGSDAAADDRVGTVSWVVVQHGSTAASRAFNVGIVLTPSARGRGLGAAAQRVLADHLFTITDVMRVEAGTAIENVRECRSLELAGFTREGVMRSSMFVGGRFHDAALYSRLRSD